MPRKSLTPVPVAPIEQILQEVSNKRVSLLASKKTAYIVSEQALKIAENAVRIARHSGRKTIQAKDIRLAYETTVN